MKCFETSSAFARTVLSFKQALVVGFELICLLLLLFCFFFSPLLDIKGETVKAAIVEGEAVFFFFLGGPFEEELFEGETFEGEPFEGESIVVEVSPINISV